jgi:hypothetical protein
MALVSVTTLFYNNHFAIFATVAFLTEAISV